MTLISIVGDVGSGKTLLATKIALADKRQIYSNYKIKTKNYHELKPEMLDKLRGSSLILLDEVYAWIESRTSGKPINIYMGYILFQSRKRGMDIVMTEQLVGTVDIRYRLMVNYEVQCEATEIGFRYDIFKLSRFQQYQPVTMILPFEEAEKIYPKYDSWELVNPIDSKLIYNISSSKEDFIKKADEHIAILLKKADARSYTKGIINDYCLRNGLDNNMVEIIYNGIKASTIGSNK